MNPIIKKMLCQYIIEYIFFNSIFCGDNKAFKYKGRSKMLKTTSHKNLDGKEPKKINSGKKR